MANDMDDFERELRETFLDEATQNLVDAEDAFMALDDGDRSPELINRIFRLAHNFKGSARSVGFDQLSQFAHRMEDVLTAIKNGKLDPTRDVCTQLLAALDVLKAFVDGLKHDTSFQLDASIPMANLKSLLENEPPVEVEPETTSGYAIFDDAPTSVIEVVKPVVAEVTRLSAPKSQANDSDFMRVATSRIDSLLNLVGELVVNQSIMKQHRLNGTTADLHALDNLAYTEKLSLEIQDLAMSLRMVPIKPLFQKLKRTARDIAAELKKEIDIIIEGEHVELDKTILDRIADPLNHIVRNAVDHGIETTKDREAAGKSDLAQLRIVAVQQDDRIQLRISDDGKGLDKERIVKKALERGLISQKDGMSDAEIHSLIFRPGFSTKEVVTDISGRGVGMEVVQVSVEELKGSIQIESVQNKGTTFIISLPLSLSIVGGLVVLIDDSKYVVPISQLLETLEYGKLRVETSTGKGRMVRLRGEIIPIYSLRTMLHGGRARAANHGDKEKSVASKPGVIVEHRGHKISFEVDEILGQQQVVLKRLGSEMRGLPGILAGAVLSNGEPGLVLNLHELIQHRITKGGGHAV